MMNEYGTTINGYNNHSDFQDMQFDFNQGWIFRKQHQTLQFPNFTYYADMDINFQYILKIKMRKVNHWTSAGEWLRIFEYSTDAVGNYYTRAHLSKWNYGTPVRVRLDYPGLGAWDMCYYTITPANELGESPEVAVSMHVFRPPYYRTTTDFKQGCTLTAVSGTRRYTAGYAA